MPVFRVEIRPKPVNGNPPEDGDLVRRLREARLAGVESASSSRFFFLEGGLTRADVQRIAEELLLDPIAESATILSDSDRVPDAPAGLCSVEVHLRPGVMDPVAASVLAELRAESHAVDHVRTARRIEIAGRVDPSELRSVAGRVLANDCIEQVVVGTAGVHPAPTPPVFEFKLRTVAIRELDDDGLAKLSRGGHLFLSLDEMRAVQTHFRALKRDPTDLEIETIAQTWSEHCVHKTLKSAIVYRGDAMPSPARDGDATPAEAVELRYENLLRDTIARATRELMSEGRGPACLSVFKDNAGVIALDDEFALAFKVETHNHPSAIEPYGGAATGIGGCIRDVLGCGLGARPIADTDVFCVAPGDWPEDGLPRGVLHPRRVLRGVVDGVGDYGNRMGIPTVNGAICFDPRYLGNPLVFCGCVGLIPRNRIEKAARPGDRIVLVGGRTGRDGIHGATFSSAELTDAHADEFSHAVQIGNAITEKRVADAVLRARGDDGGDCLYTAITDCGAGGLSSAVGEMGQEVGATVDLEQVPLKYAGLRYDEIWISEAQERMVLAVPPRNLDRFLAIMAEEEVEATVIGTFGSDEAQEHGARLIARYKGTIVGDLGMYFLHDGVPRITRTAEWRAQVRNPQSANDNPSAIRNPKSAMNAAAIASTLLETLRDPNVASKEWVIRRYDHEVQGGSVVKSLCGPGDGPADAAVLRPRLDSQRGVALGCGLAPGLSDIDPYWMAAGAIDEALRNVVCVGGNPRQTAILDNFCWGRTDDPRQLGALVRACQACYDVSKAYGTPFISGKDSLNNEYSLDPSDVDGLVDRLRAHLSRAGVAPDALASIEQRIRRTGRLSIPPTLLISAMSLVDDVARCVTPDLKAAGNLLWLVGGLPQTGFSFEQAARVHAAVADAIRAAQVVACHDCSEGWLVAVAEMAIASNRGARLDSNDAPQPFELLAAGYVVEVPAALGGQNRFADIPARCIGSVIREEAIELDGTRVLVSDLRNAWRTRP